MQRHTQPKPSSQHRIQRKCRNAQCARIAGEARAALTGALEVHRALCCPERLQLGQYAVATRIIPSRNVSGDFVLALDLKDSTVILLGDLMGKGLSAAMWITHIADLVHRAAEGVSDISTLLARLNTEVLRSRVRAPLTSVIAIALDHQRDVITCSSAGHPPALVTRAGGVELTTAGGPLLGVVPDATYQQQEIRLQTGESFIAFSDGLIESAGDDYSALVEVVKLATPANPTSSINGLLERVPVLHSEPLRDDICVLAIQHL